MVAAKVVAEPVEVVMDAVGWAGDGPVAAVVVAVKAVEGTGRGARVEQTEAVWMVAEGTAAAQTVEDVLEALKAMGCMVVE